MVVNQRKAGAVLSYLSLIINAAASFVYVPILLNALSTSEYGVYELIGSVIAYLSVMDAGLSTTLSRFYVSISVSNGKRELENLLAMTKVIYLFLTVVAVAVGIGLYWAIDPLFGVSFTESELDLARNMMVLVIVNCAIVLPGNWFLAIINAEERFVFARILSIAKYVLQVVAVVAVLRIQSSAMSVLVVQVAINALCILTYAFYVKTSLRVCSKLHRWDWGMVKSLLSFSFFILLNMVFDQVFWKTGQVVLGMVAGASAVAVYGIVCKVITAAYMQVSNGITSVFLPKLTAISARSDNMAEINGLFCRIGRIQAILVWGVCAAFIVLGKEFILLWAGPDFSEAYASIIILMLGLSIALVQNLGISVLQAKNRMGFRSVLYVVMAVLDVVISIPVSTRFGVVGCSVVAAVLLFIGTVPIMNVYYHRALCIDIPGFYRAVSPLIVPAFFAAVVTAAFSLLAFPNPSWLALACEAVFFIAAYFGILWVKGFDEYETSLVKSAISKLFGKG